MAFKPKRKKAESSEQKAFVTQAYFFYPDVLLFHVANGGSRHAMEAVNLKNEGVLAGIPDIVIEEARGGAFGLRLEFKRPDLKPKTARAVIGGRSKEQVRIHDHLQRKGYKVETVYSCEEAMAHLDAYMAKPQTIGIAGL
jgi:hypothetical protein